MFNNVVANGTTYAQRKYARFGVVEAPPQPEPQPEPEPQPLIFGDSSASVDYSVRVRVRSTDPSSKVVLGRMMRTDPATGGVTSMVSVFVRPSGTLGYRNDVTGVERSSATALGSDWHTIRMRVTVDAAAGATTVWLDGAPVAALSRTENLGTAGVSAVQMGESMKRTYTIDYDDVEIRPGT